MHNNKKKECMITVPTQCILSTKGNILELSHIQLVIVNFHRTEKYKVSNIKNIIGLAAQMVKK